MQGDQYVLISVCHFFVTIARILLPFLKKVTHYLTLAREEGLGRDPECESMHKEGVSMLRGVKKETELLLVNLD